MQFCLMHLCPLKAQLESHLEGVFVSLSLSFFLFLYLKVLLSRSFFCLLHLPHFVSTFGHNTHPPSFLLPLTIWLRDIGHCRFVECLCVMQSLMNRIDVCTILAPGDFSNLLLLFQERSVMILSFFSCFSSSYKCLRCF
jgi:hypothetical protein